MSKEHNGRILQTQLGEICVGDHQLVHITNGILGFEIFKDYVVIEREEFRPFKWIIALEKPELMFVVIDPLLFFPDYSPNISKTDLKNLEIDRPEISRIFTIVTLSEVPDEITVNLSGPIYINSQTLRGKQIALTGDTYSTKHNLFKSETKLFKEDILC